jgi:hypothetical protein
VPGCIPTAVFSILTAFIFDGTFEQEAWNDTDGPGAVLILDFWKRRRDRWVREPYNYRYWSGILPARCSRPAIRLTTIRNTSM